MFLQSRIVLKHQFSDPKGQVFSSHLSLWPESPPWISETFPSKISLEWTCFQQNSIFWWKKFHQNVPTSSSYTFLQLQVHYCALSSRAFSSTWLQSLWKAHESVFTVRFLKHSGILMGLCHLNDSMCKSQKGLWRKKWRLSHMDLPLDLFVLNKPISPVWLTFFVYCLTNIGDKNRSMLLK